MYRKQWHEQLLTDYPTRTLDLYARWPAALSGVDTGSQSIVQEPAGGIRSARRWLIAVGLVFLIAQLILFSYHRAPAWDESIYLSQVTRHARALWYAPWRSRGITLLVAPVAGLGGSIGAVRIYLSIASSLGLVGATYLWLPMLGSRTPLVAALFAGSWASLLSATEVMPNLWAALIALATAALVTRALLEGNRRHVVGASALFVVLAVFRPSEATILLGAVGAYVLLFKRARWRLLVVFAIALVIGWIPWLVEMSLRFGSPLAAWRFASSAATGADYSWSMSIETYLKLAGTKLTGSPVPGILLLVWIISTALAGLVRSRSETDRTIARLGTFCGVALAGEYVFLVSPPLARYLLPAYAMIALPCALGVSSLLRERGVTKAIGVALITLAIPWFVWQGLVARQLEMSMRDGHGAATQVGEQIGRIAAGRPCVLLSSRLAPVLALAADCWVPEIHNALEASWSEGLVDPSAESVAALQALTAGGRTVFLVLNKRVPESSPLAFLQPVTIIRAGHYAWVVYEMGVAPKILSGGT